MSADQTFHTPSFGDEEFEVPPLTYGHATNVRCGGQGSYSNQSQIISYQRSSPVSHQPQQHLSCQQQQPQQSQHLFGPPQSPQTMVMSNGQYGSPPPGRQHTSTPQNLYQNDMMSSHTMAMRLQSSYETCGTYNSNGPMLHSSMHPPQTVHLMHQPMNPAQHMRPPHHNQQPHMFSTISQSELSSQLGLQIGMTVPVPHHHVQGPPSSSGTPPGSDHNSPCRETSEDSDDSTPLAQLMCVGGVKRPSPEPVDVVPKVVKKPKIPKKKKKRDPNEPQKPVSAYALFFRDTQAAIKGQSPNASFGEVSKIVASMWDGLEPEAKNIYKKKTETAKKEYLKALAAYRATLVSKAAVDQSDSTYNTNTVSSASPPMTSSPVTSPTGVMVSPMQKRSPALNPVVDSMQPVTTMSGHPQLVANSQQTWHVQSPPHMMNGSSSPQMVSGGVNILNMQPMQPQQSPSQQMNMNRSMQPQQQMTSAPLNICHSSNSPPYQQNLSSVFMNGAHSNGNDMVTPMQTCLRSGCSNLAVDSPDWDREYCSSECVVSHCRDVFTAWVASRQVNTAFSTVK